jgi:hypothetical protein
MYIKLNLVLIKLNYYVLIVSKLSLLNKILLLIIGWFAYVIVVLLFLILFFLYENKIIIKNLSKINNNYYLKILIIIKNLKLRVIDFVNSLGSGWSLWSGILNNYILTILKLKYLNIIKTTDNIKINKVKILNLIKNLIKLILNINFLINIDFNILFGLKFPFLMFLDNNNPSETFLNSNSKSNSSSNSSSSSSSINEDIEIQNIYSISKFDNFNNISLSEQKNYIHKKMYDKGIEDNIFLNDWFISAALKNTNGSQLEVDSFIEQNLYSILRSEREAQLKKNGFERVKPFLINSEIIFPGNKKETNFPNVIPYPNSMSEYENQEVINAINTSRNINSDSDSVTCEATNEKNKQN